MKYSFLIADDSSGKIALLTSLLEKAHWNGTLYIAQTTKEAMDIIDLDPEINFAFVDYYIPKENGPAVIAYLKKKNPAARIALVSSGDNAKNNEEAKVAGAEAFICTSDEGDRVERVVMELLDEWNP